MNKEIFIGTEVKLNINIEPMSDLHMEDYDFRVEVFCSPRRILSFDKKDTVRVDADNCMILIDTNQIGIGDVKVKVTAEIPDGDFEDELRTEIVVINTGLKIIKAI